MTMSSTCLTPYNAMIVESHEELRLYSVLAAVFNWLFLAGFVVFPGTFTSLGKAAALSESKTGRAVQKVMHHTPLIVIGCLCCFLGSIGIGWIAWKRKRNHVWLNDHIFMPGLLNSMVALLMSLTNIYTAQRGSWSSTAIITVSIIGGWTAIMGAFFTVYELWLLKKLKKLL
ncbi:hypothetical protein V3481_005595 [Fusarium oxysporum f. sp. vasinfectum]